MLDSGVNKLNMSLLYVEDDLATNQQFTELFKLKISNVYSAKDGAEALEIFNAKKIDFIISDFNMPKMNGNQLCREVKKINSRIPFILLTAFDESSLLIDAIEVGIDKFLKKPISSKKLFALLDEFYEKVEMKFDLEVSQICLQEAENIVKLSYWRVDAHTKEISFSKEAKELFHQPLEVQKKVSYKDLLTMVIEEDRETFLNFFEEDIFVCDVAEKIVAVQSDDELLYVRLRSKKWESNVCNKSQIIGVFQDVTSYEMEKKELQSKMKFDPVLHALSKRFLLEEMEKMMSISKRYETSLGVIFFDIDNFRDFNNEYGHVFADKILLELSELISKSIRLSDIFGRWGGDEFVIATLEGSAESTKKFANKLNSIISEHPWENGVTLTLSVGLTFYDGTSNATELINRADFKMLDAKKSGKNQCKY